LNEYAGETAAAIRKIGKEALIISTDGSVEANCKHIVDKTLEKGRRSIR
jgi:hypothetical protein